MNNILQAILGALPAGEQIALLFIHNANTAQKYTAVTGVVNEVIPIAAQIAAAAIEAIKHHAPTAPAPAPAVIVAR